MRPAVLLLLCLALLCTSAVTLDLYVDSKASGTTCTSATPCPSLQQALNVGGNQSLSISFAPGYYAGEENIGLTLPPFVTLQLWGTLGNVVFHGNTTGQCLTTSSEPSSNTTFSALTFEKCQTAVVIPAGPATGDARRVTFQSVTTVASVGVTGSGAHVAMNGCFIGGITKLTSLNELTSPMTAYTFTDTKFSDSLLVVAPSALVTATNSQFASRNGQEGMMMEAARVELYDCQSAATLVVQSEEVNIQGYLGSPDVLYGIRLNATDVVIRDSEFPEEFTAAITQFGSVATVSFINCHFGGPPLEGPRDARYTLVNITGCSMGSYWQTPTTFSLTNFGEWVANPPPVPVFILADCTIPAVASVILQVSGRWTVAVTRLTAAGNFAMKMALESAYDDVLISVVDCKFSGDLVNDPLITSDAGSPLVVTDNQFTQVTANDQRNPCISTTSHNITLIGNSFQYLYSPVVAVSNPDPIDHSRVASHFYMTGCQFYGSSEDHQKGAVSISAFNQQDQAIITNSTFDHYARTPLLLAGCNTVSLGGLLFNSNINENNYAIECDADTSCRITLYLLDGAAVSGDDALIDPWCNLAGILPSPSPSPSSPYTASSSITAQPTTSISMTPTVTVSVAMSVSPQPVSSDLGSGKPWIYVIVAVGIVICVGVIIGSVLFFKKRNAVHQYEEIN